MDSIKCYGGPLHGRYASGDQVRIFADAGLAQPSMSNMVQGYPTKLDDSQRSSYYRQRYVMNARNPRRYRELSVFVLDGTELGPRESRELRRAFESVPWEIQPGHFIEDFEQWISECVYRITGQLWWMRERLPEYR